MMTYNPEHYVARVEGAGYQKAMDLLAYFLKTDAVVRTRLDGVTARITGRDEIQIRTFDRGNFRRELDIVKRIYNAAWQKNWGFVPMTDEEFEFSAAQMRPLLVPWLNPIVEIRGEPVAFSVALPDVNQVLRKANGRLGLWTMAKLWYFLRKVPVIRVVALGVLPEYWGRGLGTLLYLHYVNEGARRGLFGGELSWILETNEQMNKPIVEMGARPYKIYRIYEKSLKPSPG
jgi:GNAT superfamily N-acetyltransferase